MPMMAMSPPARQSAPFRGTRVARHLCDCARGDMLINAQQARPTLEMAARLGVPVFVHPVKSATSDRPDGALWTHRDAFRTRTVNCAAMITLIEGGVFDELARIADRCDSAGLRRHSHGRSILLPESAVEWGARDLRKHVYVDTMGFDPALIRASWIFSERTRSSQEVIGPSSTTSRLTPARIGAGCCGARCRHEAGHRVRQTCASCWAYISRLRFTCNQKKMKVITTKSGISTAPDHSM